LTIAKKQFSQDYHVLLFIGEQTENVEGKKVSPDFSKKTKAEAFALGWMRKHTKGIIESKT